MHSSKSKEKALNVFFLGFQEKSDEMSNAIYPTLNQVLPCYLSAMKKLNAFLNCSSIDVEPNYSTLRMNGKPEEICKGANLTRKKIHKYYEQAMQMPLYCVATGEYMHLFFLEFPYNFNSNHSQDVPTIDALPKTPSYKRKGVRATLPRATKIPSS
jgi:hypothetical protein